jgi:hypothetical protein
MTALAFPARAVARVAPEIAAVERRRNPDTPEALHPDRDSAGGCAARSRVVKNPLGFAVEAEGIVFRGRKSTCAFKQLAVGGVALMLAGCAASGGGGSGDPGPTALSGGETCQSIRSNLNRLDNQGVPALVERQNAGKKLSESQKAQADLYNRLLNQYLGARCHV